MMLADTLRVPAWLDPSAPAYKDWLHLIIFDHRTGAVGLVNMSLHGSPADPRFRVVGTALFELPGTGWAGNLVIRGLDEARLGTAAVGLDAVALAIDHAAGAIQAAACLPADRLDLELTATAIEDALAVDRPLPLGPGWISWYVVPRLSASGRVRIGDLVVSLDGASAYHDHNWGRWHWGDNFGWEWGSFLAPAPGLALVLARTTDRSHRRRDPPLLLIRGPEMSRRFVGAAVDIRYEGRLDVPLRRVPGAMAALRSDRAKPDLPARLHILADDGIDRVEVVFTARACAQLVLADPIRPGHSFVHESTGTFTLTGRLGGVLQEASGLAVVEHVD
jgi:hypothetical protein